MDQLIPVADPPVLQPGEGPVPPRWWHLGPEDRAALGMWAAAHAALLVLAWAASWVYRAGRGSAPLTGAWDHWDAQWYQAIAAHGYFSAQSKPNAAAFFPGYPAVLAGAHLILGNWVLAELAVATVAGGFAVVSLARLAGSRRAVLYLLTMPAAVFLMAGYAEGLFLALAIPAWHAGTRGRWRTAALLAGLSGLVRPDALFLIPALVVMALTGPQGRRLAGAGWACLALAGPGAYEAYLTVSRGWDTWRKANEAGWYLRTVTPVSAWKFTWGWAFGHQLSAGYAFEYQLELGAMIIMVAATVAFLVFRRWPQAAYCGLAAVSLGTQTYYQTGTRTVLVLFPVCVALAAIDARHPWARWAWLSVMAPLAAVVGLLFLAYQWAG